MASDQLDRIFSSISFEGEDIDPELMKQVMEKMRADLGKEVGQGISPQNQTSVSTTDVETIPPSPSTSTVQETNLPQPPPETMLACKVNLLRFDGVKETQEFSMQYNASDTASHFLESILNQKDLKNGISRMDKGSPDSISPGTLIQPLWKTMGEVMLEINHDNNETSSSDKITIHWYPCPDINNNEFSGGGYTGVVANWIRIITLTRNSIFVHFNEETTLFTLKKEIELKTGVAIEWQRLMFGSKILQFQSESQSESQSEYESKVMLSQIGIKPGINLFLTHRIDGMEYQGTGAGLT